MVKICSSTEDGVSVLVLSGADGHLLRRIDAPAVAAAIGTEGVVYDGAMAVRVQGLDRANETAIVVGCDGRTHSGYRSLAVVRSPRHSGK